MKQYLGIVSTLAGSDNSGFSDGMGNAASFDYPSGIDLHPITGDIYVADFGNFRIRTVSAGNSLSSVKFSNYFVAGVVTTVAGTGASGLQDGKSQNSTFSSPIDVKINTKHDSLLVADRGNNKIREIHKGSGTIYSFYQHTSR